MISYRIFGSVQNGAVFLGYRLYIAAAVCFESDGTGIIPFRVKRHIAGRAESDLIDRVFECAVGKPAAEGISVPGSGTERYFILDGVRRRIIAVYALVKHIIDSIYDCVPFGVELQIADTAGCYGSIRDLTKAGIGIPPRKGVARFTRIYQSNALAFHVIARRVAVNGVFRVAVDDSIFAALPSRVINFVSDGT